MVHNISFPGLNLDLGAINPVAFVVFGHPIMWYGIIISTAFLLAAAYAMKRSKAFGLNEDIIIDLLIFATPMAIIGARLYFVAFHYDLFRDDFWSIFRIWEGGIAVYGSIIFGVLTAIIFCMVRKINLGTILDICAPALLIGQCIGRWGNFFNAEAFGSETTLPWRMVISTYSPEGVHPTFLYESLWTALGFLLLHFLYTKRRKYSGEIFNAYVAWYGFGRGLIEGLRTDSLYLFGTGIRVSQLLGFASFAVAVVVLLIGRKLAERSKPFGKPTGIYGEKNKDTGDNE